MLSNSEAAGSSHSASLADRYRVGDESAATAIFERYVSRLTELARSRLSRKLAARIDPDDIVMSAYRSLFSGLRRGDYHFDRAGDLWRLLVEITLHKLYRQAAHHSAERRNIQLEQPGDPAFGGTLDREPSANEVSLATDELEWLLGRLPPIGRRVLELRLQGARIDDIARDLSCSERTVRRLFEQAKTLMTNRRQQFEQQ